MTKNFYGQIKVKVNFTLKLQENDGELNKLSEANQSKKFFRRKFTKCQCKKVLQYNFPKVMKIVNF